MDYPHPPPASGGLPPLHRSALERGPGGEAQADHNHRNPSSRRRREPESVDRHTAGSSRRGNGGKLGLTRHQFGQSSDDIVHIPAGAKQQRLG